MKCGVSRRIVVHGDRNARQATAYDEAFQPDAGAAGGNFLPQKANLALTGYLVRVNFSLAQSELVAWDSSHSTAFPICVNKQGRVAQLVRARR